MAQNSPDPTSFPPREALIVFEDRPARGFTRFLRPGFRHCFCLIRQQAGWFVCDPLKHSLEFKIVEDADAAHIAARLTVIDRSIIYLSAIPKKGLPSMSLRPLTCVEIVKRVVGINKDFIFTPYQLFSYLSVIANGEGRAVRSNEMG